MQNGRNDMADPVENKSESSDERTSGSFGSLFKANISNSAAARQKELPRNLSREYMSIDEFCSTNSSDEIPTSSSGFSNVRLHTRSNHPTHKKLKINERICHHRRHSNILDKDKSNKSTTDTNSDEFENNRRLDREVIAEMDRQYDHNICLDRFINQMEHQQQGSPDTQRREGGKDVKKKKSNQSRNEAITMKDKTDECGKTLPKSSSSELLGKAGSGSSTSGSSSLAPRSNDETDSRSRESSSVKSSTPENTSYNYVETTNMKEADIPEESKSKLFKTIHDNQDGNASSSNDKPSTGVESGIDVGCESTTPASLESSNNMMDNNNGCKKYKGGKPGRKRKRGYIYDPKPVRGKPPKKRIPDASKDIDYWEKRKRNNEAARKSREMRRKKEQETNDRLDTLKKENDALRVAIALLSKRNETLEYILTDYAIAERQKYSIINNSEVLPVTS